MMNDLFSSASHNHDTDLQVPQSSSMAVEEVTTAEDGQPKLSKEEILQTIGVDDLANQESFQASLEAKFQAECDKVCRSLYRQLMHTSLWRAFFLLR